MKRTAVIIIFVICLAIITACSQEPPHVHNYVLKPELRQNPTCTSEGLDTYICSCGDSYTRVLPKNSHVPGQAVNENETAPTCTDPGKYDSVVYCSLCHKELSRETLSFGNNSCHRTSVHT